ncbi:hypothetical protein IWZ00DRAFT_487733 [Phyllosticta capitalensis]
MIPIDVLSLTANIIQVVDFGIRVTKQLKEQYRAADGMVKENRESLQVAKDLRKHLRESKLPPESDRNDEEEDLLHIFNLCDGIAGSLQAELENLCVPATAHKKTWTLRKTVRAGFRKGRIQDIEKRLHKVQHALDTRLMTMIRSDTSWLRTRLDELAAMDEKLQANTSAELLSMRCQLIDAMDTHKIDYARIAELFKKITNEDKETQKALDILKLLRYADYSNRYHDITEAHQRTFQWIFDNPEHQFTHWLEQQSGIYWITGKPGSGKSTLVKFIVEHDQTREKLLTWASQQDLIVAQHYFWISGSKRQRSLEGFLRSIVFQILRKCPYLISKTFPQLWNDREERELGVFSLQILKDALPRIAYDNDRPKICLFIDGLDEFEGDQNEVLQILKDLDASPSFKLCVSSRPWAKFENAFRNSLQCRVHELTRDDIRQFARENIVKNSELTALMEKESDTEELVNQITEKASGVFFWVFLVVRMLLEAPDEGANFQDLQAKIDSYPTELDDLFARIFTTIKPEFRRETARILKICLGSLGAPSLVTFDLPAKFGQDTENIFYDDVTQISGPRIEEWKVQMEKRIGARCKDFLNITQEDDAADEIEIFTYRVEFMHRTVKDYLMDNLMPKLLNKEISGEFDVSLMLSHSCLAELKSLDSSKIFDQDNDWRLERASNLVIRIMVYCRRCENRWKRPVTRLIDEMDHILSNAAQTQDKTWIRSVKDKTWLRSLKDMVTDLLDLKVQGLKDQKTREMMWRYLLISLMMSPRYESQVELCDNRMIIKETLRLGADANQEVPDDGRSIWEAYLYDIYWMSDRKYPWVKGRFAEEVTCEILISLLQSGADPNILVQPKTPYLLQVGLAEQEPYSKSVLSHAIAIDEVVRKVLPGEKYKVLEVLEQKRAERATLDPGHKATKALTSPAANPGQSSLINRFWNVVSFGSPSVTQQASLEAKPSHRKEFEEH